MTMTMTTTTVTLALRGFIIAACHIAAVMPAPAIYDQRQTGDLNVQVDLKDVHVVALINSEVLEDYTDYDYFYDYADFTVKPSGKPTTSSTTESIEKNNVTEEAVELASSQNLTISGSTDNITNSMEEIINDDLSVLISNNTNSTSNTNDKSQSSEEEVASSTASSIISKSLQALRSGKRCKSGYIPNGKGRCRRANRRWLSLLS